MLKGVSTENQRRTHLGTRQPCLKYAHLCCHQKKYNINPKGVEKNPKSLSLQSKCHTSAGVIYKLH